MTARVAWAIISVLGWVYVFQVVLPAQSQAPQPPHYIRHVQPWTGADVPIVGANPVRPGTDVVIEWDSPCATCSFRVVLDGALQRVVGNNNTMFYQYGWGAGILNFGQHVVEIEPINDTPCPPATARPSGCSRFFAFTTYDPQHARAPGAPRELEVR